MHSLYKTPLYLNGKTPGSLVPLPPVVVIPKVEYPFGQGVPSPKLSGCTTLFARTSPDFNLSQIKGRLVLHLLSMQLF